MATAGDVTASARKVRRFGALAVAAFSVALALAILGPLLVNGWVLLLDYADYPVGPHPDMGRSAWGFPPGLVSRVPIKGMLLTLFRAVPWEQVTLLPLAVAPLLAAWGFWRIFQGRAFGAALATLLFVVNPFMYQRMAAGQLYLVIGFSLLPALFAILTKPADATRSILLSGGMMIAFLLALAPHFAFIAAILAGAIVVGASLDRDRSRVFAIVGCGVVAAILSIYWIVPVLDVREQLGKVGTADLHAFRTLPDADLGLVGNVAGLYGFWNRAIPLPKSNFESWPLLLACLGVVVAFGIGQMWKQDRNRLVTPLLFAGAAGAVLAMGDQAPLFGSAFKWSFEHIPGFKILREPQKFLALLTLSYAVFYGAGARALLRQTQSRWLRLGIAATMLIIPCVYTFKLFWGFGGYVRPSVVPASWTAADRVMGPGTGKVLALPWHLFLPYPWTQGRVVANPASGWFRRDVVMAENPEFDEVVGQAASGRSAYLERLYDRGWGTRRLGRLIAPLGIEYVALFKVADWERYGWLFRQSDLEIVGRWRDLSLFRNQRRVSNVYVSRAFPALPTGRSGMRGMSRWARETGRNDDLKPLATVTRDPHQTSVLESSDRRYLILSEPFDRNWTVAASRPQRDSGAVNVFEVGGVTEGSNITYDRWSLVRASYVAGAVVWGIAVGLRTYFARKSGGRQSGRDGEET